MGLLSFSRDRFGHLLGVADITGRKEEGRPKFGVTVSAPNGKDWCESIYEAIRCSSATGRGELVQVQLIV